MVKIEAETYYVFITSTILVSDWITIVKFNWASNYSYVSVQFVLGFDAVCYVLDAPIHVPTPVEDFFIVTYVYCTCPVRFYGFSDLG